MCTFLFWMVRCEILERCFVVFVNLVYYHWEGASYVSIACMDNDVDVPDACDLTMIVYGSFVGQIMKMSCPGNTFRITSSWCGRNSPMTSGIPTKPLPKHGCLSSRLRYKDTFMRSFCAFFVDRKKLLNKTSISRWFETPWRLCDVVIKGI